MSRRLTKKELDEQFELFLKESVSDDSVDLGGSDKQSDAKSSQKPTVSWWQDDEHSGGGTGRETARSRFIKTKKSQPENNNVVSAEPFYKPVPKPRCKAVDKPIQLDQTHKATVLEVSQTVKRHRTPSYGLCSDSQSSPTHENLQCVSGERSPDETHSDDTPPASTDSHSQGDSNDGLLGSGKTFRKSLRKSQSIQEEDEDPGDTGLKGDRLTAAVLSSDSIEQDSVMVPAENTTNIGLDTIEEEEEKARFFAQLEAGALSTIDYSKLNRELDSTSSTIDTKLRKAEEAVEQSDDDQRKARVTETVRESPALTGSPHYSEDFDEEENGKEPLQEKPKMSPILAKVSLHDSLDDTGGEDKGKDTAGSLDRGQSYVQSGGSEMEALREAYRQIHVVEDSDDHNHHYSSLEGKGRINRPVSPSSPPQHARQSLQPVSTNESELPTAEELMKPIRPERDHIRGFSLQPVSAVGLHQEKTSSFMETSFPDVTSPESQLKRPEKAEPAAGIKGARGLTSHPSSSPEPLNLTWSIRQEVERLMQDQDKCSSSTSSQADKAKKQQVSRGSTFSHSSTSSVRKPTVASVRGRRVEGRAAVTSRLSGLSRTAAPAKTHSSVSRPLQQPREKINVTKTQEKEDYTAEAGLKVSSELVASVQSLVAVLQQQIDTSSHQDVTDTDAIVRGPQETRLMHHLPDNNREQESSLVEELRVQLAQRERELQIMKEGAEELNSLRQQNYLLQSKLRSAEEASQKKRWAEASDSATEEKLRQIDKEIKEQETLIKGYQQENEKLYLQMKAQQVKSKANEEAMFNENQRLLNELAFTREQLNKTSRPIRSVCLMDHTQRITDLLAQIKTFESNEAQLSEDIHRLKQEKQALEVDLQLMKKERDLAKAQAMSVSGDKSFEKCVLEDKHREEVTALKKKLQWFAENQELLDRDAGRLKAATAEIRRLNEQVEKLKMDVGRRSTEQQRKAKEKTSDTKRMQDLERQVKELEQILRRRNPNSLPALIYAAATAGSQEDVSAKTAPPSRINTLLERRIQRLEAELEGHDEEAKRSLRAMEQQFHRIKLRYEQQISELEQQLQAANCGVGNEPWTSQVQTLEEELQHVKESHQEKENSLQDQIESLQQQLKHKAQPSPGRHQHQAEAAFGARIERLNQDLASKTRTIQELSRTVERLQKERRNMLSVPNPRPDTRSTETKRQPGPAKTLCSATAGETHGEEETFPAAQYEKTYQPTVFTGSHISEVQQENEALKQRLELLELHSEQERDALKADAQQAREELCRLKERSAEQLSSMKAEHLRELDQLRATHALEHSSSKVAELANKLSTQEIVMKHLQDQLKELQGAKEALAISRTREDALQKQLTRLLKELKEAKEAQSPEVKLLCSLERKIFNMELRHQHREKELQQVIGGSWQTLEADQESEVETWKRLAQDKSRELEAFRQELDSILDILRHLQRQGVVLPTPDPSITAPLTQRT
ncbi:centrosomal protein of 162 kDa isoform X1 [Epinephelus lanceolatus]|uniref:centrosomal protein of 162 kDa isoform X1 n=1 Tax=Epinephelus lanceolatus TaxID=310571 RepID=UPI001445AF01|nr:centrosomal protein of 162 kDa isoform X1 [Epinephelus lanceolatus]XP_033497665.1 centrosomal protein of 162 kDa isoform X1 [Epinephelus lanceolatus]